MLADPVSLDNLSYFRSEQKFLGDARQIPKYKPFIDLTKRIEDLTGHACFIAGGAIRDFVLDREPKDIDIFVAGDCKEEQFKDFDNIPFSDERPPSDRIVVSQFAVDGIEQPIQIMSRPEIFSNIDRIDMLNLLLDSFDWETSLFCMDIDSGVIVGRRSPSYFDKAIHPEPFLHLQKMNYPFSNLKRGFRFAERFGFKLHGELVTNLYNLAQLQRMKNDPLEFAENIITIPENPLDTDVPF